MFSFENYHPCFDESEFKDKERLLPKKEYPMPSKLYKSTATIITTLNQNINIDYLYNFLKCKECKMSRIEFYNQITMVITIDNKKKKSADNIKRDINTKIFQNGTIHMTGGQTTKDAKRTVKLLLKEMKKLKIKVKLPDDVDASKYPKEIYCVDNPDLEFKKLDYRYEMINRHFNINFEYCPGTLYKILQEKGWRVNFNPNRFSGVVLSTQIQGFNVTYLMFKSGKITISLCNTTDDIIRAAYYFINDIFKTYYDRIVKREYDLT